MNVDTPRPQLLVSVRSVAEAEAAFAGGAALIDIKEPSRGSLGQADPHVIRDVAEWVGSRRPVSAALGEWADGIRSIPDVGLSYVKWGLAGCARRPDWRGPLTRMIQQQTLPRVVLVAYADWQCAQAPSVEEVFTLACEIPGSVMLVDTHCKDASNGMGKTRATLLDWLPVATIEDLCARCRDSQVKIALAGSLGSAEISALRAARPDWFAVRGAVCTEGDREATVHVEKVKQLVREIARA